METLDLEPQVLANRRGVAFGLIHRNSTVECVITILTLEAYFWLEPQASDARILKTFRDGYGRIRVGGSGSRSASSIVSSNTSLILRP